jgi:DNA-directed RNA polymerase alpha subunit
MSRPDKEAHSGRFEDELERLSESFERYDLTGYAIKRWSTAARTKLIGVLRRVFALGKKVGETKLPGTSEKLSKKAKELPGKTLEFIESQIEKTPIENQLKASQTETEFLKQELLREQIMKTHAETRGQELDNLSRMIEIQDNIRELTAGKTDVHVITQGEKEILLFGNLKLSGVGSDTTILQDELVSVLDLSKRSKNYLIKGGIVTVNQLINYTKMDLITIKGIGKRTVEEIVEALQGRGLSLRE